MYGAETYGNGNTAARGGEFMFGLVCGAAVGAAIGLLFAPKAGSELRSQLADSADKIRRRAGETYDQASQTVNDVVDKGRDALRRGREKFDEARSTYSGTESASGMGSTPSSAPSTY